MNTIADLTSFLDLISCQPGCAVAVLQMDLPEGVDLPLVSCVGQIEKNLPCVVFRLTHTQVALAFQSSSLLTVTEVLSRLTSIPNVESRVVVSIPVAQDVVGSFERMTSEVSDRKNLGDFLREKTLRIENGVALRGTVLHFFTYQCERCARIAGDLRALKDQLQSLLFVWVDVKRPGIWSDIIPNEGKCPGLALVDADGAVLTPFSFLEDSGKARELISQCWNDAISE